MTIPNPEADQAIENGRPLKELVPLFPSRAVACEYYAERMAQRYCTAEPQCAHCDQQTDAEPLSFVWRANVHTAKTVALSFPLAAISLLGGVPTQSGLPIAFATQHRLCAGCRRRYDLRAAAASVLHYAFFALLFVALLCTVLAMMMLFVAIFYAHEMLLGASGFTIAGLLVLGLLAAGFEMLRRWPIPPPLRRVGQFPFALDKVQ